LTLADIAVIAAYGIVLLIVGGFAARSGGGDEDLALGSRSLPTWAVLCSMTATELSAATFIGVPQAAYTGDWSYLQLAVGALLGKGLLARYVIPLYHRAGVVTVYGYLGERFGPGARSAAALTFVFGRILASGARLFIAALAVSVVTGFPITAAIVIAGTLSAAYTLAGGIRSVIYTDVLQGAVFLAAAAALLATLVHHAPGGMSQILTWADEGARTRILHLDPLFGLANGSAFGTAVLGAFFLTLATHATDYDMVQRLLTTPTARGGGRALLGSALVNFPLTALFLLIGTGIAHAYATPPPYPIDDARVLPVFALNELPSGVRGLVFAGLFAAAMSSLDSAICAIATTWVSDVRGRATDGHRGATAIRRSAAVVSALLIASAAGMASYHALLMDAGEAPNLVEFALATMSIVYGGLVGVFGVGLLTRRRGSSRSAVVGLAAGGIVGVILFMHPLVIGATWVAWTWWIPISGSVAFAVTALIPTAADDADAPDTRTMGAGR
jgi:SSS family solute:Na+ symporter